MNDFFAKEVILHLTNGQTYKFEKVFVRNTDEGIVVFQALNTEAKMYIYYKSSIVNFEFVSDRNIVEHVYKRV